MVPDTTGDVPVYINKKMTLQSLSLLLLTISKFSLLPLLKGVPKLFCSLSSF